MCDLETVVVLGSGQWDTTGKKGWGTVPNKAFRSFLLRAHRNVQLQDEYLTSQVLPLAPLPPSPSRSNRPRRSPLSSSPSDMIFAVTRFIVGCFQNLMLCRYCTSCRSYCSPA